MEASPWTSEPEYRSLSRRPQASARRQSASSRKGMRSTTRTSTLSSVVHGSCGKVSEFSTSALSGAMMSISAIKVMPGKISVYKKKG